MSRRLDYTIAFDAPAKEIYENFTSREYWQTLINSYRCVAPQSEITEFRSGAHGTDIVVKQNLPPKQLPQLVRTVLPVDVVVTREQHFDPFDRAQSRAKATCGVSVLHGPGHFGGRYLLTETDSGSQLQLASVCKVYIPFVGRRLEELVVHHMKEALDAEEAFTADWIEKLHG